MLDDHQPDIDPAATIPALPQILELVCRTTGMGYAAVVRFADDRWIACSVRDEIGYGIAAGNDVGVATAICDEVRSSGEVVFVEDARFGDGTSETERGGHRAAPFGGIGTGLCVPILLSDGSFFGTLCAFGPEPRPLRSPEIAGTFRPFADLVAFHIEAAHKLAESQRLLDERRDEDRLQRVLQRELAHRMKNTLAMVQAVVTQSLRGAPSLDEAARSAGDRIEALARAQDMLTASNWETADIRDVVSTAIAPHLDGASRFEVKGPGVELTAQQSMGLALAIHELATNAVKYGALSNRDGRIHVAWSLGSNGLFRFQWDEAGGPAVVSPSRKGFGSRLTERVVPTYFQGRASLAFEPAGFAYCLTGTL